MADGQGFDYLSFDFDADPDEVLAALEAVDQQLNDIARRREAGVDVDVDTAALTALQARLAAIRDQRIEVNVDTDRGLSSVTRLLGSATSSVGGLLGRLKLLPAAAMAAGGAVTDLGRSMTSMALGAMGTVFSVFKRFFILLGLLVILLPTLISLINVLGGGLFALGAAMGPAVGILAALPGLAIAAGAGLFTLIAGFQGVFEAVRLGEQAQEGMRQGAIALTAAQQRLRDALREVTEAQKALNEARRDYPEDLEDAQMAAVEAHNAEERALYNLTQAQKRLAEARKSVADITYQSGRETDDFTGKVYEVARASQNQSGQTDDLRDAILSLQEAQAAYTRAQDTRGDSERRLAELQRQGVEGSDKVVAALERLRAANRSVRDAETARDEAQKIATGRTEEYAKALRDLSPAGRSFVKFIQSELLPAWRGFSDDIQQALLPGIQSGMEAFMAGAGPLKRIFVGIAGDIGEAIAKTGEWLGSAEGIEMLTGIFKSARKVLGSLMEGFGGLARAIGYIVLGASDMTESLSGGFADSMQGFADKMKSAFEDGSMQRWFDRAKEVAGRVWNIIKNIGGTIFGIGKASNKAIGDGLLKDLESVTGEWLAWVGDDENQKKMMDWFKKIKKPLYTIGDALADAVKWFVKFGVSDSFQGTLDSVIGLGKAVGGLIENISESRQVEFFLSLIGAVIKAINWVIDTLEGTPFEIGKMYDLLLDYFGWLKNTAWPIAKSVFESIRDGVMNVVEKIQELWEWAKPIRDFLTELGLLAWEVFTGFAKVVWELMAPIKIVFGLLWKTGEFAIKALVGWITWLWEKAQKIFGFLNGIFVDPFMWLLEKGAELLGKVREKVQDVKEWIGEKWAAVKDFLTEPFKDAYDFIKDKIDDIREAAKTAVSLLNPGDGGNKSDWTPGKPMNPVMPRVPIFPGRQVGGSVQAGQPYIVGEKRAEIFIPSRTGRIVPNTRPLATGANTGGGLSREDVMALVEAVIAKVRPVEIDVTNNDNVDTAKFLADLGWEMAR